MKQVEIYTGPGCAHCRAAKALLDRHAIAYREHDVSDPAILEEFRRRLPRVRSLPQIMADGEHLGGYEDLVLTLADRGRDPQEAL